MKKLLTICSVLLMLVLLLPLMGATTTKSLVIEVSEDTYAVADLLDTTDPRGFGDTNYGSEELVVTWYLWNVEEQEVAAGDETEAAAETEPEVVEVDIEKYISIVYLKFDLSQLEDKAIDSAMLQLYTNNVSLITPRYVQAYLIESAWEEATLTFNTAPAWGDTALATTVIYQAEQWYGWDVTEAVDTAAAGSQISLAVMLRDMTKASEELVAFPSRESGENAARLLVTYATSGFAWYWWPIGGVVFLALLAAAFFGGAKLMRRKQPVAPAK